MNAIAATPRVALLGAALAFTTFGCKRRDPLEPASSAEPVPGITDSAQTSSAGVKLVARTRAWNGSYDVLDDVTPVLVEITNGTDKPLSIRYADFDLIALDGTQYPALPPFATNGSAELPVTYSGGAYPGFWGAPYYAAPGPVVAAPYPYSWYPPVAYDYDAYYGGWAEIALPTPLMLTEALPEGALDPGAKVAGFLYFDRVDDDKGEVDLRMSLVDAETNERFARATIPFRVDEFP